MANLRFEGFTYQVIIKPWKKGNKRFEILKYPNGLRNLWERISKIEYDKIKKLSTKKV